MKNPNENEEEMEEREWVINGFKTFSAIAQEYFPEYSNADTASKRMRNEIELDKQLFDIRTYEIVTHIQSYQYLDAKDQQKADYIKKSFLHYSLNHRVKHSFESANIR